MEKEIYECEDLLCSVKVLQRKDLYRFTCDAILLAKFATVKKGDNLLDLCSGSGVIGLYLYGREKNLSSLTFVELQPKFCEMTKESIALNGIEDISTVINCKLQDLPKEYHDKYNLIVCNPPYRKVNSGEIDEDYTNKVARHEVEVKFCEIVEVARQKLKDKGRFCLVHRADRLAEILYQLKKNKLEPKRLQFIKGKKDSLPHLVLIEAVKGGREDIKYLPDLILE